MATVRAIFLVTKPSIDAFKVIFMPTRQSHMCPHVFETNRTFQGFYDNRIVGFDTQLVRHTFKQKVKLNTLFI